MQTLSTENENRYPGCLLLPTWNLEAETRSMHEKRGRTELTQNKSTPQYSTSCPADSHVSGFASGTDAWGLTSTGGRRRWVAVAALARGRAERGADLRRRGDAGFAIGRAFLSRARWRLVPVAGGRAGTIVCGWVIHDLRGRGTAGACRRRVSRERLRGQKVHDQENGEVPACHCLPS
jgi:hypothetical protein